MKSLKYLTVFVLLSFSLNALAGGSVNAVMSSERELGKIWQSKQIKSRVGNREISRIFKSSRTLENSLAVFIEKLESPSGSGQLLKTDVDILLRDINQLAEDIRAKNFRNSAPDVAGNCLHTLSSTKRISVMALNAKSGFLAGKGDSKYSGISSDLTEQLSQIRKFRKNLATLVNES